MIEKQRILTVNTKHPNLTVLNQVLSQAGYATEPAATLEDFDAALAHADRLDLALVDITGFNGDIWSRCERLRQEDIPLLLIAARHSCAVTEAGSQHGANDVLVKPLAIKELVNLIRLLLAD
jgi:DNA-binding response OmpR family regulator